MSDDPSDPGPPESDEQAAGEDDDAGRGWTLATVTVVALILGVGAGVWLNRGDDPQTKTVKSATQTVLGGTPTTAQTTATAGTTTTSVTVTQEARTVVQTVTVTVPAQPSTNTETTQDTTPTTSTDGG